MINLNLKVNGSSHSLQVEPTMRLVDLLRENFLLTSVKESCGTGECGSCTVLVNGKAVNSCLVMAAQLDGSEVMTMEYLSSISAVKKLQNYFIECGAVQCGYCTPGMIISALDLLKKTPKPGKEAIKRGLSGNICRCTGYAAIVEAISKYSQEKEIMTAGLNHDPAAALKSPKQGNQLRLRQHKKTRECKSGE